MKTFIFAPSQGNKEATTLYNTTDEFVWIQENNTKSLASVITKLLTLQLKKKWIA